MISLTPPRLTKERWLGGEVDFAAMKVYNKSSMLDRRRELRQNATRSEELLWSFVRREQRQGVKFKRQYSVDGFVLDFYAPSVKLAIEVDGASHQAEFAAGRDAVRQKMIEYYGIKFIRFTDDEVMHETDRVLAVIDAWIEELRLKRNVSISNGHVGEDKEMGNAGATSRKKPTPPAPGVEQAGR